METRAHHTFKSSSQNVFYPIEIICSTNMREKKEMHIYWLLAVQKCTWKKIRHHTEILDFTY